MKIRFVSRNKFKIQEVQKLLAEIDVDVVPVRHSIEEIQTENIDKLVRNKLLSAFTIIGRPVLVEHTGLYIDSLNSLPGGLTQIFWDKLQADKFSSLFGRDETPTVLAKTIIGYCDTRKVYLFEGSVSGTIASEPRGSRDFQWDCVFVPDGESETFAEMGERKNDISMRRIAFDKFKDFLKEGGK